MNGWDINMPVDGTSFTRLHQGDALCETCASRYLERTRTR